MPPANVTTAANQPGFPVVGPPIWNYLPDNVTSAESLSTFRQRLTVLTRIFHEIICMYLIISSTGLHLSVLSGTSRAEAEGGHFELKL